MEQKIIIEIDENGEITANTKGIKGGVCLSELQEILETDAFTSIKTTDEFKMKTARVVRNQQIKRG